MLRTRIVLALMVSASVAAGCSRSTVPADKGNNESPPPGNTGASNGGLTPEQQTDWNKIAALEAEAKTLVKVTGCASSSECRTAPVGSRGCGGPRYYIPYCAKATDSAALASKLDQVAKAEQAYNTKYQLASTCEMRMPPPVTLTGGVCTAQ
jgi:hypothetical protein